MNTSSTPGTVHKYQFHYPYYYFCTVRPYRYRTVLPKNSGRTWMLNRLGSSAKPAGVPVNELTKSTTLVYKQVRYLTNRPSGVTGK